MNGEKLKLKSPPPPAVSAEPDGIHDRRKFIVCIESLNKDGSLATLPALLSWEPEKCRPDGKEMHALNHFLLALSRILDAREKETYGHSHRVSLYVAHLARALGLSPELVSDIERAGLMHDVGKVAVPDSILLKPGPLTAAERATMEQHPLIGWQILQQLECIGGAAKITLHHHERFDGQGYPHRLAGEDIPLGSRIIALGDTLDAMTTTRSYRRALPFEAAYAEILRCRGSQFDPDVADCFAAQPPAIWANLAKIAAPGDEAIETINVTHNEFPGTALQ